MTGIRTGLGLLALAGAFGWTGCTPPPPPRPHVVVYMIDTLRADHLGVYGYERPTSPVLDEFAKEAVTFRRAYAQASWTRASVGTLLTGRYPSRHGAVRRDHRLDPNVPVMAELLGELGYSTAGFYSNPNLLPEFGFERGFDVYQDIHTMGPRFDAKAINQAAYDYLDTEPEGPLFLYLHTMNPHAPYKAPPVFDARFRSQDDSQVEAMIAGYDGEIVYTDAEFGMLLARLREEGIYEDSILVVVSDHGEEFFDHGYLYHGHTLFEEQIHVPLLVRLPKGRAGGTVVEDPVRVMDVLPSILEELRAEPPEGIDGESFLGLIDSPEDSGRREIFAEQSLSDNVLVSLVEDGYKLIRRDRPEAARGTLLYNLKEDPKETTDLFAVQRDRAAAMLGKVEEIESTLAGGIHVEFTNASHKGAKHSLKGSLVAVGGHFAGWEATGLQDGDRMHLNPAGTRADFEFVLANDDYPTEDYSELVLVDMVRVRFTMEPVEAGFRLELYEDGQASPSFDIALGSSEKVATMPLPFDSREHRDALSAIQERPVEELSNPRPCVRIYSLPTSSSLEIDPELDKRLRALGYIGDN